MEAPSSQQKRISVRQELRDLVRGLRGQVESWLSAGVLGVPAATIKSIDRQQRTPAQAPRPRSTAEIAGRLRRELEQKADTAMAIQDSLDFGSPDLESAGSPDEALERLKAEVASCTRCTELAATRTQTVFGQGNPRADLMFVGEAPGQEEDRQGLAFVGRAGKMLTEIIDKAMNMRRQDVYICNILKSRPPENRNPSPQEVVNCMPYLLRQIEIIRPKVICTLGSVATQMLLETRDPIGRMRGRFFKYRGIKVLPTYHPAYVLRNYTYETRKKVYDDVLKIVEELGRREEP